MENPYHWPEDLVDAWLERLRRVSLNRYPPPAAPALQARLREVMAIPAGAELILGNGSDELIQLIALAVAAPGRTALAPAPSFVMYRLIARAVGLDFIEVPLKAADFSLDLAAMLAAIEHHRPAVIFLAYPNNPTGNRFEPQAVQQIIKAAPGLVVADEAYFPFAQHSFLADLPKHDHLLIMRTLSKLGLAGLRLGFVAGAPHWLREFDKVRLPYNINILTQVSAEFALAHWPMLTEQIRQIRADRASLLASLHALPGVTAFPSETNFILLRTPPDTADAVFTALRTAGILVKNLHRSGELLGDCLRVTVGTPAENQAFLAALGAALAQK